MDFLNSNIAIIRNILFSLYIIIFSKIISSLIAYIIIKMFNLKEKDKSKIKKNAFYKPIKTIILLIGIYVSTLLFNIPENIKLIIYKVFKICVILVTSKGFLNLFNTDSYTFKKIEKTLNFKGNDALVKFVSRALKILVYIVAGFIIVSEFGYNLGGLVTGVGISSVVIALAAQDLAKSLFGGLCIILDKPFSIGDYIVVNNYEGVVEDVTFRTTRIRNLENELIIIPNSEITADYISNWSKRNSRKYEMNLVLELGTSIEKIVDFKNAVLLVLQNENHVLKENIRIYFDTISDNGFDVKINCYTDILPYNDFLNYKEELNLKILNLLQIKNIELAYDSKTIYLKKD